jgi:hypothetical protein
MKRYFVIGAAIVSLLLALTVLVASGQPAAAAGPVEVGAAIGGVNAVEFVGRVDQNGGSFVSYGYLTHISGLTDTLLFSGTLPFVNETNAHFTFYTTATLTSRYVITGAFPAISPSLTSSVFVIDAIGQTVYYYTSTPGGTFADPTSFAAGIPIVTATVRSQNVLNVQSPGKGLGTNFSEFTQAGVSPFTLDGITYQLGQVGLMERLFSTGEGINTDPLTPKSFTVLSGNAIVTGVPGQQNFMPLVLRNAP